MKEIKFRQFVDGEWHYWGFTEGNTIFIGPASLTEKNYQYTGLKDKKRTKKYPEGQEIYEGDIIWNSYGGPYSQTKMIVCWHNYHAGWSLATRKENIGHWAIKMEGQQSYGNLEASSCYEVIGNIRNHSEFTEESKNA